MTLTADAETYAALHPYLNQLPALFLVSRVTLRQSGVAGPACGKQWPRAGNALRPLLGRRLRWRRGRPGGILRHRLRPQLAGVQRRRSGLTTIDLERESHPRRFRQPLPTSGEGKTE